MDPDQLKKALAKLLEEAKEKRRQEDAARKEKNEADRMAIFQAVGKDIGNVVGPYMQSLKDHTDSVVKAIKDSGTPTFEVKVPPITIPKIEVPQARVVVPKIEVPPIRVPDIKMPDEMNVKGWVGFMNYDRSFLNNPLPVQLRDADGNPVKLFENLTSLSMGAGGGGGNFPMQVLDVSNNALRVSGSFSVTASNSSTQAIDSSGNVYTVANPFPVQVVSGGTATSAVNLVDSSGVAYSGSNPVPTSATLSVPQGQGDAATAMRVVIAGNSDASVTATQTGTWNIGTVTTVTAVTGITNTVAAMNVDSSGVGYSGSNPLPITGTVSVTGSITSVVVTGPTNDGGTDDGSNPLKVGGIARTTNPTAHGDGQSSALSLDDLGRQITRPVQVRDLIRTAYVAVTNGTETTLRAAVAGAFLDCIMVTGSNNSDAAVAVDIRAVTAGSIIHTMQIPAYGLAGWSPTVPWPQDATGNNWTVDLPDITGTTVSFSGLFSQEV